MYFSDTTQTFALKQTVAPAEEPVTTGEAKTFARIEFSEEDALIASLVAAARYHAEIYTRRQFVTATWRLSLDWFPDEILLPRAPGVTVTSITYAGTTEGTWDTLAASQYVLDTDSEPARIWPTLSAVWPITLDVPQAVKIVYTAGYGAATAVPEGIKTAIKWLVGWWMENREAVNEIPAAFYLLLDPFQVGDP